MRKLLDNPNVDNSNPADYPFGRIKNNTGANDGTPVDERVYGDYHQTIARLMILAAIDPNNLPDNVTNGFQIVEALIALASKNDYLQTLGSTGGVLQVSVKIGLMQNGEMLLCKSTVDVGAETTIKGSDNAVLNFTKIGDFKTGDYVHLIRVGSAIQLVRDVNQINIDAVVAELEYLKASTYAQELAGTSDAVATNPLSNLLIFVERVNGASSAASLATALRNGLYPKEHFQIVENLGGIRNKGWFSGVEVGVGTIGQTYPRSGQLASVVLNSKEVSPGVAGSSTFLVTLAVPMDNLNYYVRYSIQSEGTMTLDNDIAQPVFKPLTETTLLWSIQELFPVVQSLKIHLEVIQY